MSAVQAVVEVAVKAKTAFDKPRLREAMDRLVERDLLATATLDEGSGQIILRGIDERHLNFLTIGLLSEVGKSIDIGSPQVAYRETFASSADADYSHKNQMGSSGQFARVMIRVEPNARGQGVRFVDATRTGNIPVEYIPAIEQGILDAAAAGLLIGSPVIDFTATLVEGISHDIDSSALAFKLAARGAMREAAQKAGIELLEPIMRVAIVTRTRWLTHIKNNLIRRRASLEDTTEPDKNVIIATAPMAMLFGIENDLTALTRGESAVAMLWDHYASVPPSAVGPDDKFPSAAALRV